MNAKLSTQMTSKVPKKPSPEYISKLINVIQECKSETGVSFEKFISEYFIKLHPYLFDDDYPPQDYELIQALRELQEKI